MLLAVLAVAASLTPLAPPTHRDPGYGRIRAALERQARSPLLELGPVPKVIHSGRQPVITQPRDSIWNGVLIGAGIGAGGGYLWGRGLCGDNDRECSFRAIPAGVLGGAAIGAAVGGVIDALQR